MSPGDLFKTFPGFPALLCVLPLLPLAFWRRPAGPLGRHAGRLLGVALVGGAALALALAFANLAVPDYVDNVEPPVVGNAWIWWHGGELYPRVAAGLAPGLTQLRGLLYGPLTFLLAGLAPLLLGPSILASKLPPALLFVVVVALAWHACRRAGAGQRTALLASAAMTVALGISEAPYWVRGDVVLLLLGALGAWLVARPAPRPLRRAVLLGLLAGSASAVKLHGAAYLAPACLVAVLDAAGWTPLESPQPTRFDWWRVEWRRGGLAAGLVVAAALVAVAWPFLLPGISLGGYAFYLGLAARHGFSTTLLLGNLTLLLAVCLPILALRRDDVVGRVPPPPLPPRWRVLAAAAVACAVLVALVASKPGAGYPHMLPFLPYAALLLSRVLPATPGAAPPSWRRLAVAGLFCLAFGVPVLVRGAVFASRGAAFAAIAQANRQVREVLRQHPGEVVAVGYGGDSFLDLRLSYLRVLPVFAGNPLLYDATAMDDLWQGGVDRAVALREIDDCGVRIWLLPGDAPFGILDFYGGATFAAPFLARFQEKYQRESSTGPFQVWTCRQ